ncbi:hypothetical protein, conserved, partial [Eimeria tenella]
MQLGIQSAAVLDPLGTAIARGPLLHGGSAAAAAAAATAAAADAEEWPVPVGQQQQQRPEEQQLQQQQQLAGSQRMQLQQTEQQQKMLVMLLHGFSAAERRHELCDKIFDCLLEPQEMAAGVEQDSSSSSSSSGSSAPALLPPAASAAAAGAVLPHAVAAIVALSLVKLKAFDRTDVIRAIAEAVMASDVTTFSPQQITNILYAFEQIEQHRWIGETGPAKRLVAEQHAAAATAAAAETEAAAAADAEAATDAAAGRDAAAEEKMVRRAAARLAGHATVRIKQLSPQLLGSAALSAARAALQGQQQQQFLLAAAFEVPALQLQGSSGLHASTALLAALVEGWMAFAGAAQGAPGEPPGGPPSGVGGPHWGLGLPVEAKRAVETATADLAAAGSSCSSGGNSSSSSLQRATRAADGLADADAAVAAAAAAAAAAQERVLFSRLARLDVPFLMAFANAVAAPRTCGAAAAAQQQQQQEQEQQQNETGFLNFRQQLQRFLPLTLLQEKTAAEVYRHAVPRQACGSPAYLLQHWRVSAAATAAAAAQLPEPQREMLQQGKLLPAAASATASAASFLVGELRCTDTAKVLQAPAAYARRLIAFAELAQPGRFSTSLREQQRLHASQSPGSSSSSSSSSNSSSSNSSALEAGPEQVLNALLSPLKANPGLFPSAVCAAAARVAMETGVGDPLFLERVLRRLACPGDQPGIKLPHSSSSSSSSRPEELLPAAAFLDLLRGAAAAAALTRPSREALETLWRRHRDSLLQR